MTPPPSDQPIKMEKTTINKLWGVFIFALVVVVGLQFFVHPHPYFGVDGAFWFYPVYGLFSSVAMVLVSKLLGIFLKRPENYWQEKK